MSLRMWMWMWMWMWMRIRVMTKTAAVVVAMLIVPALPTAAAATSPSSSVVRRSRRSVRFGRGGRSIFLPPGRDQEGRANVREGRIRGRGGEDRSGMRGGDELPEMTMRMTLLLTLTLTVLGLGLRLGSAAVEGLVVPAARPLPCRSVGIRRRVVDVGRGWIGRGGGWIPAG